MRDDPIVEEIRGIRDAHAARFNYDLEAIYQDVKRSEDELRKHGWVFVNYPSRRADPRTVTNRSAE